MRLGVVFRRGHDPRLHRVALSFRPDPHKRKLVGELGMDLVAYGWSVGWNIHPDARGRAIMDVECEGPSNGEALCLIQTAARHLAAP